MFRRKTQQPTAAPIVSAAVADTDAAVAAKMRGLARQTSNPDRANTYTAVAEAAEAGQLHPELRADWARGVTFPQ
ncbi:MAG: hypothetical protein JF625_24625 [Inquilinus limosus]|jgi:hypothetical protein|uniref:Uncharacterized protein n=1 Tax=Inquilinus limosus TaxID=171674 RepID=A0A952KJZ8_9PROT|nr:hypothetical protein [Inquilinus limosus]